ncbi:MAG: PAS domain S-box protein [Planctomycetota bacterium]|nr:MAG: PAS domain S-box protein [Planctomycetota bacterium]
MSEAAPVQTAYQELLRSTREAVFVRDAASGEVIDANPRACELVGATIDELRGMPLGELSSGLPGYTAADAQREFRKLLTGESHTVVWQCRRRDGELFWAEFSISPLVIDGRSCALILARDVTAKQHEVDALRRIAVGVSATGERFFAELATHLAELLDVAYVLVAERLAGSDELKTRVLYAQGTIAENLVYPLRGTPCAQVLEADSCVVRSGAKESYPDDPWLAEHDVDSYAGVCLRDGRGNDLGVLSVLDVKPLADSPRVESILRIFSVRAAAELERLRIEELHRASESRFRAIVETTSDVVWEYDTYGVCHYCNDAVRETLGLRPDDLVGRNVADLLHPDDQPRFRAQLQTSAESNAGWSDLVLRWRATAGYRFLQSSATTVTDAAGAVIGFRAIERDVTERIRVDRFRAGQNHVLELMLAGADLRDTLTALVRSIESQADGMLGSVLLATPDGRLATAAAPSLPPEYSRAVDGLAIGNNQGSCGTAAFRNERVVVDDIASDTLWEGFRKLADVARVRSCWSEPIRAGDGTVLGTFALYYREPRKPTDEELRLIEEAARLCRLAIERDRAERDRRSHTELLVNLERIDRAIRKADDVEHMLGDVLDTLRSSLGCDRAGLLTPCDPHADTWRVPVERAAPEYAVADRVGEGLAVNDDLRGVLSVLCAADDVVCFAPDETHAVPDGLREQFGIRSMLAGRVTPKVGPPWALGVHQCSYPRRWAATDVELFRETARRIGDALGRLLAHREVAESRAMLRLVLDAIPVRVFWKDRDSRYLGCNPCFARDAGLERPDDIIGKTDDELPWRRYARQYRADDRSVIETCTPKLAYEEPLVTPAGATAWLRTSKIPLRDTAGRIIGVLGVYEDITEQKRVQQTAHAAQAALLERERREKELVEAELARARQSLVRQTRLAAIGQVAASIAHELRNPLGAIRNSAFFLRKRLAEAHADVVEHLGIIDRQAAESNRIITDLLEMSRAVPAKKRQMNLETLAREAFAEAVDDGRIELRLALDSTPFEVFADPSQLAQVLRNLFANAAHAMSERGGVVRVRGARWANGVTISVADSGPGVDPEARERIFEPLFTSKAKGTGLGLTICRQIIEQHGGTITLANTIGRGAEFQIHLPDE